MMVKSRYHIFAILLMACMIVACGSKADRASLVAIDSLILQNPDSACELLAEYPADSLTTDDDRAYHALLTTIADYKAYRPATTDSAINIAVDHYDHNGANPDHRMRSLLYKGCVMEELGDPEQAIEYYKRAETVCPTDDYFNIGYICYRKALLYQTVYADSIPIQYYRKAVSSFQYAGNKIYEAKGLIYMGLLYSQCDPDSAQQFIEKGILMAKQNNDSVAINEAYNSLCTILYIKESYNKVTELVNQNYVPREGFCNRFTYDIISISFSKLGHPDSAETYLKLAPMPNSAEDSVSEMRAIAELALAKGDFRTYIKYNDLAVNNADSILIASQADKIREAEAKYDMAMMEVENLSRQKKLTVIISVLSLVVIAVLFVVYVQRKRIATAKKENETAQIHLSALKIQIADSLKQIETLKKQQDTSPSEEQLGMLMQSIEGSLACYSSLLANVLKQTKTASSEKNTKLAAIMDEDFFAQLHLYLNLRYDNLIDKLADGDYNLSEEEVNIICLELCRFPNPIQWAYSNCDRYKSLLNKKKIIANKVNGSQTIANIPQNI